MVDFGVYWPRLDEFVGRAELLEALHAYVWQTVGGQKSAVLTGPPGIGKTQLAVEYAYRYRAHYQGGVYWIDASRDWTPELAAVAQRLRLKPTRPARSVLEHDRWLTVALQRYLADEQDEEVLLILNDVSDPRHILEREVGPGLHVSDLTAHLLVTTTQTNHYLPHSFRQFEVGPLLPPAAAQLLGPVANADQLMEWAGYVPMALKLITRVLDGQPLSDAMPPIEATLAHYFAAQPPSDIIQLAAAFDEQTVFPLTRLRLMSALATNAFDQQIKALQQAGLITLLGDHQMEVHRTVLTYVRRHLKDYRAALRSGVGRLLLAYHDPETLYQQASERGVRAVLLDVQEVWQAANGLPPPQLTQMLRYLEWEAGRSPEQLIQHLRERTHHQSEDTWRDACDVWLADKLHFATKDPWRYPRNPSILQTFIGHEARITDVLALDSQHVVTTSHDGTLRVWDLRIGHTTHVLRGHQGGVTCAARLDGDHIISGAADCTLRVWRLSTAEATKVWEAHQWSVTAVIVLEPGIVVSGGADDTVQVWDIERSEHFTLEGHLEPVTALCRWDNQRVLSASHDGTVRLWNLQSRAEEQVLVGHDSSVMAVVKLDDQRVLTASSDGTLRIWHLFDGQVVQTLRDGDGRFVDVVLMDGNLVVVGASDGKVRVWNLTTGRIEQTLQGHTRPVTALARVDEQLVASVSSDLTMRLWDAAAPVPATRTTPTHADWVTDLLPLDERYILSASTDHTLRISDVSDGTVIDELTGHEDGVNAIAAVDEGVVISASSDRTLRVWDLRQAAIAGVLEGHSDEVLSIARLDNRHVLSGSFDNSLRIWDWQTGATVMVVESPPIMTMLALPDQRVLCGTEDGRLLVWELNALVDEINAHKTTIRALALLPDGRVLSASSDRTVRLWDIPHLLRTFEGHTEWVNALAVVDSRRFLTASFDGTLRLWDQDESEPELTLHIDSPLVSLALLSPNQVVVGDVVGRLRVLRIYPSAK